MVVPIKQIDLPTLALDFVVSIVFVVFSRAESLPIIRIPQLLQVNKGWWLLISRIILKGSKDKSEKMKGEFEDNLGWMGGWDSYSGFAKCRHLHGAAAAMHSYSSEYVQLTS